MSSYFKESGDIITIDDDDDDDVQILVDDEEQFDYGEAVVDDFDYNDEDLLLRDPFGDDHIEVDDDSSEEEEEEEDDTSAAQGQVLAIQEELR